MEYTPEKGDIVQSQAKKREAEDSFRTASWEEHSDTLLGHLYRITTRIMITLEWNKSELLLSLEWVRKRLSMCPQTSLG
jgi:hypothetical protein